MYESDINKNIVNRDLRLYGGGGKLFVINKNKDGKKQKYIIKNPTALKEYIAHPIKKQFIKKTLKDKQKQEIKDMTENELNQIMRSYILAQNIANKKGNTQSEKNAILDTLIPNKLILGKDPNSSIVFRGIPSTDFTKEKTQIEEAPKLELKELNELRNEINNLNKTMIESWKMRIGKNRDDEDLWEINDDNNNDISDVDFSIFGKKPENIEEEWGLKKVESKEGKKAEEKKAEEEKKDLIELELKESKNMMKLANMINNYFRQPEINDVIYDFRGSKFGLELFNYLNKVKNEKENGLGKDIVILLPKNLNTNYSLNTIIKSVITKLESKGVKNKEEKEKFLIEISNILQRNEKKQKKEDSPPKLEEPAQEIQPEQQVPNPEEQQEGKGKIKGKGNNTFGLYDYELNDISKKIGLNNFNYLGAYSFDEFKNNFANLVSKINKNQIWCIIVNTANNINDTKNPAHWSCLYCDGIDIAYYDP